MGLWSHVPGTFCRYHERMDSSSTASVIDDATIAHQLTSGRDGWPEVSVDRKRRQTVYAQLEDEFLESFYRYFKNAEEKRRWNMDRDIPWELAHGSQASDVTALIVESFSAVEMFLPDYTHRIMELVRRSRGRAWFQANWGYEESKHSMVLDRWLLTSGKRTEAQMEEFERSLLGAEWNLPFETPRQMIIYTMVQELATGVNYTNLRRRAADEGDACLEKVLRWVSADESAHYNFFRRGVKAFMALEPEETVRDIKFVFDHFTMPAHALIPGWDERGATIEAAGVYGPRVYLAKIRRPVIEDLQLTREQLKGTGLPIDEADAIADRAEERARELAEKRYDRFHSSPSVTAATHPARTVVASV